jgi:hypothetical protein
MKVKDKCPGSVQPRNVIYPQYNNKDILDMLRTTKQIKAFRQDEGGKGTVTGDAKTPDRDGKLRRDLYEQIERGNAFADVEEDAKRMLQFGTRIQ